MPVVFTDANGKIVGNIVQLVQAGEEAVPFNFEQDEITGALVVISVEHHEVHEGEMFTFTDSVTGVADAASRNIRLVTGDAGAHFSAQVSAGGSVQVYLYEGATLSGGTPITAYNMKRDDTTHSSPLTVYHTPTVTATGSVALINGFLIPGGNSNQTRVGGGARPGIEWILKPNTEYLFRITNVSGGNITISSIAEFYEG